MKVFITGGLGFVGKKLTDMLISEGNQVTVMGRRPPITGQLPHGPVIISADASMPGEWQRIMVKHDVIINLAGVSIFTRWNDRKKKEIYDSRIQITKNIVDALKKKKEKKIHFFSSSAVGYYGFSGDKKLAETDIPGEDFLAGLCRDWEAEAMKARDACVRIVISRFGVILGHGGGSMDLLEKLFRLRLGNRLGTGKQWFSWIHENDVASIFKFLLNKNKLSGPFNLTSPNPATNLEFTKILNRTLRAFPLAPPVPAFAVKMLLGEFGDFLLQGQRVIPERLMNAGFAFKYPNLSAALNDLTRGKK